MARVAMIAGMDRNRLIGKDNGLPWHIPEDMRRFVRVTRGKSVIMGRLTYESIGKPLPDRDNHVITRNPVFVAPGCTVHDSLTSALSGTAHEEEVVIMFPSRFCALRVLCRRPASCFALLLKASISFLQLFRSEDASHCRRQRSHLQHSPRRR